MTEARQKKVSRRQMLREVLGAGLCLPLGQSLLGPALALGQAAASPTGAGQTTTQNDRAVGQAAANSRSLPRTKFTQRSSSRRLPLFLGAGQSAYRPGQGPLQRARHRHQHRRQHRLHRLWIDRDLHRRECVGSSLMPMPACACLHTPLLPVAKTAHPSRLLLSLRQHQHRRARLGL